MHVRVPLGAGNRAEDTGGALSERDSALGDTRGC